MAILTEKESPAKPKDNQGHHDPFQNLQEAVNILQDTIRIIMVIKKTIARERESDRERKDFQKLLPDIAKLFNIEEMGQLYNDIHHSGELESSDWFRPDATTEKSDFKPANFEEALEQYSRWSEMRTTHLMKAEIETTTALTDLYNLIKKAFKMILDDQEDEVESKRIDEAFWNAIYAVVKEKRLLSCKEPAFCEMFFATLDSKMTKILAER